VARQNGWKDSGYLHIFFLVRAWRMEEGQRIDRVEGYHFPFVSVCEFTGNHGLRLQFGISLFFLFFLIELGSQLFFLFSLLHYFGMFRACSARFALEVLLLFISL